MRDQDKLLAERIDVAIVLTLIVQQNIFRYGTGALAVIVEVRALVGPQTIIKQEGVHCTKDAGLRCASRNRSIGVVRRVHEGAGVIDEIRSGPAERRQARGVRPSAGLEDIADVALKEVATLHDSISF